MPLAAAGTTISLGSSFGLAFLFLGIALLAAIAALSHAGERAFSAAIVYLVLGLGAGVVVRAFGVGRLASPIAHHRVLEWVTDAALILGLFSTGMRIRRKPTLGGWNGALRLVAIAMPVSVAVAALWAKGAMGLGVGAAIALGAALAPTDPVLAGDLGVDPPRQEEKEDEPEPEFVLTAEAGLNDGVTLPFLLLGAALTVHASVWHWAATQLVYGVAVALVVGVVLGRGTAWASCALRDHGFLSTDFDRWVGLAASFGIYGAAEALGALGFVAVFAGGVAFRRFELEARYRQEVHGGADTLKHLAELAAILVLGSTLALDGFGRAGAAGLGLAALSVFVIRPLVAYATLARAPRLARRERLWIAWFGVKGIASLNYAAVAVGLGVFGRDTGAVVWTVLAAVTLSVVVHGISSKPVTQLLLLPLRRDGEADDDDADWDGADDLSRAKRAEASAASRSDG